MRLSSVTIQGFKSFGNRVTIEFSPSVTAVVGPNGSGKSNVLDAIKWATGGGRARQFRAEDKTDLIFHGAAGKRSLGFAEVEVELSDGRRNLTIRRDLDRDGTSRLRLNGKIARFIDVDEALAGSGLGTAGVAIIGQGEVSGVLMADPVDLLQYLAEAAGVSRLSGRREQTMARLQSARGHLERLEDVLATMRDQVEQLADEAADAQRHQALSREALRLRVTAADARVAGLTAEVAGLRSREVDGDHALVAGATSIDAARAAVARARSSLGEAEVRYREATALVEARRGAANLAEAERDRAHERATTLEARVDEIADEVARLAAIEPPVAPEGDGETLARLLHDAEAAAFERRAESAEYERAAAERARGLQEARTLASAAERAWAAYASRASSLEEQLEAAESHLRALEAAEPEDPAQLERIALDAERASECAADALEVARSILAEHHRDHAEASAEAQARSRAAERLRAALASRQGYAHGPKQALTSRIPGVIGSVADLVTVEQRFAAAIGGALGRRSEYVVVDTATTGERVLAHVRTAGGWVTVLPLDLVRGGRSASWPAGDGAPGVVAAAIDLIDVGDAYRGVFESLLGDSVVVETMHHAAALARGHRRRPRLVTLDGDTVDPGGAMSGGRRGGVGVLGAAKELEDAVAVTAAATQRAEDALARVQSAQDDVREATAIAADAKTAHAAAADAYGRARAEALGDRRMREDGAERVERLRAAMASTEAPTDVPDVDDARERVSASEAAWVAAEETRRTADVARFEVEGTVARAREAHAVHAERRRAYDADRERYDAGLLRLATLREEIAAQRERLALVREEVALAGRAAETALAAIPDLGDVIRTFEEARESTARADSRLDALTTAQADLGRDLEEVRITLARREAALELAQEERAALPAGVEVLDLAERPARARLREVEEALEAIGPVNHRAADDLAARRDRLETLEVEAVQAILATTDLEATLERIDRETTARLAVAIEGLKTGFRHHVRSLFGAEAVGEVDVDLDGARHIGLRIRLQPPGKQTQSLGLLSVGERTMGALAFLFALMADEGRGLPIAVLDEVDAPLDEANIRRFGEFLETLSQRGTQFVLITHQKATFEVADTLWGVTTEAGVSRVFSMRREGRSDPLIPIDEAALPEAEGASAP